MCFNTICIAQNSALKLCLHIHFFIIIFLCNGYSYRLLFFFFVCFSKEPRIGHSPDNGRVKAHLRTSCQAERTECCRPCSSLAASDPACCTVACTNPQKIRRDVPFSEVFLETVIFQAGILLGVFFFFGQQTIKPSPFRVLHYVGNGHSFVSLINQIDLYIF